MRWRRPSRSAPAAPHGGIPLPRRLVDDEADAGPVVVEHADARRVEGHAPVRVGRAVDRVDDGEQPGGAVARQRPTPRRAPPGPRRAGPAARRRRPPGRGGTARARPGRPPVLEVVQRGTHRGDGLVEHLEQAGIVHGRSTLAAVTAPAPLTACPPGAIRLLHVVAAIDVAGYVADLKDHSVDHGFHVHDERHFVETYSLRQVWEVDLHPEEGCGGPLDLHLALDVDPRVLLSFEDAVVLLAEDEEPPDEFHFPLTFTWALPPLPSGPDLLRLAIDLAGVGGIELPLEVSAIDSFANATDGSERRLSIVARHPVSLARVLGGEELLCDVFDRALAVSRFLLESAEGWLG